MPFYSLKWYIRDVLLFFKSGHCGQNVNTTMAHWNSLHLSVSWVSCFKDIIIRRPDWEQLKWDHKKETTNISLCEAGSYLLSHFSDQVFELSITVAKVRIKSWSQQRDFLMMLHSYFKFANISHHETSHTRPSKYTWVYQIVQGCVFCCVGLLFSCSHVDKQICINMKSRKWHCKATETIA